MDISSIDKKFLSKQEKLLTSYLREILPEVKRKVEIITEIDFSIHSFHAHIGAWNNYYVDSIRTKFIDPNDFIAKWLDGLRRNVEEEINAGTFGKRSYKPANYCLIQYLKDSLIKEYVFTFLTRNFYKNFKERIRSKPDENLWSVWFGSSNLVWGLVIEPVLRNGSWTNDKSEMRRAEYNYWTIGHVMATGLIDPDSDSPIKFNSYEDFISFYKSVIIRMSQSQYEKQIAERYIAYLKASPDLAQELLLIPELRYAGKEVKHIYRLDYTILNPYIMKMTGFEISPASTHVFVEGIKSKTQKEINSKLSAQWSKEIDKRNRYFRKYGISTITFTDTELDNIEKCFGLIEVALQERSSEPSNLQNALSKMELLIRKYSL